MNVSNHLLVGSAIALGVPQPVIALPLALASHFILDALPHFGYHRKGYQEIFRHKLTYVATAIDCIGVGILLAAVATKSWMICITALVAAAPDVEWLYRYAFYERKGYDPPASRLWKFHDGIQWCERPWGLLVEIIFFIVGFITINRMA